MNNFKTLLTQLLIVSALLLPWTTAGALETFEKAGFISDLGYDLFVIRGQSYRIAPGAKLRSNDAARQKFSDFKVGDEIWSKGKILNGVYYVDIISYETPEPS